MRIGNIFNIIVLSSISTLGYGDAMSSNANHAVLTNVSKTSITKTSKTTLNQAVKQPSVFAAEIIKVEGMVKAIDKNKKERILALHSPIFPEDTITTGNKSHASLRFTDGTIAVLGANSKVIVASYRYNNTKSLAVVRKTTSVTKVVDVSTPDLGTTDPNKDIAKIHIVEKKIEPSITPTPPPPVMPSSVEKNDFKLKLETGEIKMNAGEIARTEPKVFNVVTPVATVGVSNPNATVYYTPASGLAFAGLGYILGSHSSITMSSIGYAVVDQYHSSPSLVTSMPSVLSTSDSLALNSILQNDIATYGENTSFSSLHDSINADLNSSVRTDSLEKSVNELEKTQADNKSADKTDSNDSTANSSADNSEKELNDILKEHNDGADTQATDSGDDASVDDNTSDDLSSPSDSESSSNDE